MASSYQIEETTSENIKAVVPAKCPHCNKDIIVQFEISAPKMTSILTLDQVDQEVKKLIEENNASEI